MKGDVRGEERRGEKRTREKNSHKTCSNYKKLENTGFTSVFESNDLGFAVDWCSAQKPHGDSFGCPWSGRQ